MQLNSRVECKPHLDCWMQGERYGRVVRIQEKVVHVRMFKTGRIRIFSHLNVDEVKV